MNPLQISVKDNRNNSIDPRIKIMLLFLFIGSVLTVKLGNFILYICHFLLILSFIIIMRINIIKTFLRLATILPFIIFIGLFMNRNIPGQTGKGQNFTTVYISYIIRSGTVFLSIIAFSLSTRFNDIIRSVQKLRIDSSILLIFSLMYRYIFIIAEEAKKISIARNSRYFGGKHLKQLKVFGNIIGILFVRSFEKGNLIYKAMLSRGFRGRIISIDKMKIRFTDILYLLLGTFLILLVRFGGLLWRMLQ